MPLVGLGTWQAKGTEAYDAVRYALEHGYRHIDTATMYGNESEVGRAVRDSGVPREDVFITTKLWPSDVGRERQAIDTSLAKLGSSYVDLWLIHWHPDGGGSVPAWRRFLELRDAGLVRAAGVSNYTITQVDELIAATGQAPEVNQVPWGPRRHDPAFLAASRERGVVVEGYSPFKNANLRDRVLVDIAAAHGVTVPQVVIRWHVQHGVVAIPKSSRPERIVTNADVFGFALTDAELASIDRLS
jgi:diketogulonate reductase-like aldo/keto reductase